MAKCTIGQFVIQMFKKNIKRKKPKQSHKSQTIANSNLSKKTGYLNLSFWPSLAFQCCIESWPSLNHVIVKREMSKELLN